VRTSFYNAIEYIEYLLGKRELENVRSINVEALVDAGSTFPALPEDKIEELGLPFIGEHQAETAKRTRKIKLAAHVIVKIEDRISEAPVIVRPRGTTPLVGVVVLEQMGYRIDPITGKLIKDLPLML